MFEVRVKFFMKKFISFAAVFVFFTSNSSLCFAKFCEPEITKDMIKKVRDVGFYQNSGNEVEDGFSISLTTLDFFQASEYLKFLYDPLITRNMRLMLVEEAKALSQSEIAEAAKNGALDSFWWINPVNWFSGRPELRKVAFEKHDEKFFLDKISKIDAKNVVGQAERMAIAQFMVDNQVEHNKIKQSIIDKGYEKIDASARSAWSSAGGAGIGALGGFVKWAVEKKLGDVAIKYGLAMVGVGTGIGLLISGVSAGASIYLSNKYNIAELNEANYKRNAIAYEELVDRISATKERAETLVEKGYWIGKNAFFTVVPTHPDCHINPITMFKNVNGLDEPETLTRKRLAKETCKKNNCEKDLDKCKDYLVFKVDACIYKNPHANCADIPEKGCKELETWKDIFLEDL